MKRFVDVRESDICGRFAFYDTITDQFETHDGVQVFDNWEEFSKNFAGRNIERYKNITPEWAMKREEGK